ncbi:MAG: hypothetical protein ACOY16_10950 [Chloroflexota bacterium]
MPGQAEQPQNTFVVRFWWEWQEEGLEQRMGWRGRVEHVQSGEGMTFRDLHQLLAFIERFVVSWSSLLGGKK